MFFHVSRSYLGKKKVFIPKVPENSLVHIEGNIHRVCVSDNLYFCLRSIIGLSEPKYVAFREFSENPCVYFTDEMPFIPPESVDFRLNNEHWFLKPTKFFFLGRIDMNAFMSNGIISYTDKKQFVVPKKIKDVIIRRNEMPKTRFMQQVLLKK